MIAKRHIPLHRTVHYFKERHFSDKRIGNGLVNENGGFAFRLDLHRAFVKQSLRFFSRMSRERFADLIQQSPHTPKFGSGTAKYRDDIAVNDAFMNGIDRLHGGNFFSLKVFHHQIFIGACNRFHQHITELFHRFLGFLRNQLHAVTTVVVKHVRGLFNQIDRADHFPVFYHGNGNGTYVLTERVMQGVQHARKPRFVIIEFIDKKSARELGGNSGIPSKFSSDFDPRLSVYHDHGTVRNAECLCNFPLEIQISGGINDIDANILPHHRRNGGGNGKLACNFFGIVITYGISRSDITETVCLACKIQHCFRQGCLTRAAVSQQCQISDVFGFDLSHDYTFLYLSFDISACFSVRFCESHR